MPRVLLFDVFYVLVLPYLLSTHSFLLYFTTKDKYSHYKYLYTCRELQYDTTNLNQMKGKPTYILVWWCFCKNNDICYVSSLISIRIIYVDVGSL